jgi:hypothetical protein
MLRKVTVSGRISLGCPKCGKKGINENKTYKIIPTVRFTTNPCRKTELILS